MSFPAEQKRVAAIVLLSLVVLCRAGTAQPKKPAPDPRAVFDGYVRVLCEEAGLAESVHRIKSFSKIYPAIAKAYSVAKKGDLAGGLAALDKIPKPIAKVPVKFLYWELRGDIQRRLGDLPAARRSIRELLTLGGTDTSRVELQAWRFLRELGEKPVEADAKRVLGVVVQVNTSGHVMAVAGYADGSSRFANDFGVAMLGDKKNFPKEIQNAATALSLASQRYLGQVPLQGDCKAPGKGDVQFAVLTPAGIHTTTAHYEGLLKSDHPLHGLWTASNNLIELSLNYYKKMATEKPRAKKFPVRPPTGSSKSGPHR